MERKAYEFLEIEDIHAICKSIHDEDPKNSDIKIIISLLQYEDMHDYNLWDSHF